MQSADNLILAVEDELTSFGLSSNLGELVRHPEILRWLNVGLARLGLLQKSTVDITWSADDTEVALPAGIRVVDAIDVSESSCLPAYRFWDEQLIFPDKAPADGEATVYYRHDYPMIAGAQGSELRPLGDDALIAYALSRFFARVAASRADFRRYVTVTGQSGIDVDDLIGLSDRYLADFEDAREVLQEDDRLGESETYYGD